MLVGVRARLDLEAVVPVALPKPFQAVARDGQLARLPLLQYVTVLVQHQPGIVEEVLRRPVQIDAPAAGRGNRAGMQPGIQGMLDDAHVVNGLTDHGLQRGTEGTRKSYVASNLHDSAV